MDDRGVLVSTQGQCTAEFKESEKMKSETSTTIPRLVKWLGSGLFMSK